MGSHPPPPLTQALGGEIVRLRAQLAAAQQELDERPERKEVVKYIGEDEIRAAEEESQRAFASRQPAWQAWSEIQCLHRERNNGQLPVQAALRGMRRGADHSEVPCRLWWTG